MASDKKSNNEIDTVGKVYAKWCGACKVLTPNWKTMKEMVGGKVNVVEFETDEDKASFEQFQQKNNVHIQVNGFPTLFKLTGGNENNQPNVTYYEGARDVDKLKTWALGSEQSGGKRKKRNQRKTKSKSCRKNKTMKNKK